MITMPAAPYLYIAFYNLPAFVFSFFVRLEEVTSETIAVVGVNCSVTLPGLVLLTVFYVRAQCDSRERGGQVIVEEEQQREALVVW